MSIELKVPVLPESVADATIATWHKKAGDTVQRDENLVDLETDKVVLEVPAPADGVLTDIAFEAGATVTSGQLLAKIDTNGKAAAAPEKTEKAEKPDQPAKAEVVTDSEAADSATSPGVRRLLAEHELDPTDIKGSGKDGRLTKEDVTAFIAANRDKKASAPVSKSAAPAAMGAREEKRVPMSRLRAKVAERLLDAQHSAAMLTTFNEVNLQAVMDLRAQYKDSFEKKHGVKLGFMSFFTKAVVESLKRFPVVNASVDGQDIVYHASPNKIEKFRDSMFGAYFSYSPIQGVYGNVINNALLNIKSLLIKPKPEDSAEEKVIYDKEYRSYNNPSFSPEGGRIYKYDASVENSTVTKEGVQIKVRNPEQIHILGSEQDIENFKKFVANEREA